jgi:hypothetical protein
VPNMDKNLCFERTVVCTRPSSDVDVCLQHVPLSRTRMKNKKCVMTQVGRGTYMCDSGTFSSASTVLDDFKPAVCARPSSDVDECLQQVTNACVSGPETMPFVCARPSSDVDECLQSVAWPAADSGPETMPFVCARPSSDVDECLQSDAWPAAENPGEQPPQLDSRRGKAFSWLMVFLFRLNESMLGHGGGRMKEGHEVVGERMKKAHEVVGGRMKEAHEGVVEELHVGAVAVVGRDGGLRPLALV